MTKQVNIGIIGYGTVGKGTVGLIIDNWNEINRQTGIDLYIAGVADRSIEKKRNDPFLKLVPKHFKDQNDLIADPDIDVIVELIGGTDKAKEIILCALENGKHVVTANKALIARYWKEIFKKASEKNRLVLFESSVGGGIPVIRVLREDLSANKISEIKAIINGTCNYILTRMDNEEKPYPEILEDAQRLGYAEADPASDIEGDDSAYKMLILASIAFGRKIDIKEVSVEGISNLDVKEIKYAKKLGYKIKLIGTAKEDEDGIEVGVAPTMMPEDEELANVNDVFNAIQIKGNKVGKIFMTGRGAGGDPTASAVVGDIIAAAKVKSFGNKDLSSTHFYNEMETVKLKEAKDLKSAYYIRLTVLDEPGILSKISGTLAAHDIGIHSVLQYQEDAATIKGRKYVPLIMIVHETKRERLDAAMNEVRKESFIEGEPVFLATQIA